MAPVVLHRSPRYNNKNFPWSSIWRTYGARAVFIGAPSEWHTFCATIGPVPYHHTANLLEVAKIIAGSDLFIGNQSSPAAIAEGLKHAMISESCPGPNDNCHFARLGRINGYGSKLELPQLMASRILNVRRRDTPNLMDGYGSPHHYFNLPADEAEITELQSLAGRVVIVGGGDVTHLSCEGALDRLVRSGAKKLIAWGIGSNCRGCDRIDGYPNCLRKFDLVGLRDHGQDVGRWCPCASCMSPLFDRQYVVTRPIVVYRHCDRQLDGIPQTDLPTLCNDAPLMSQVVEFLASAETVITSSYHGAYWATLLGRNVIAYPFSSKFFGYRHPPVLLRRGEPWRAALGLARAYPAALEECRAANRAFHKLVVQVIGDD